MSKLLIGGEWVDGMSADVLRDKYRDEPYGEMAVASPEQVDAAVAGAEDGVWSSTLSPYDRYRFLLRAARLVEDRMEECVALMRAEAGFTRADSENEVRRCVQTLELSAEEAKRLNGELVPMLAASGAKNRLGFTIHAPRGVICAITPFNSPLNTLAHKVGPALAGGNAVVIKPSNLTPLSAVLLCEVLLEAGLPPSLLALVHGSGRTIGRQLLADQRIAFYAFTGSTAVGREIQQAAGLRGVQLELGSIASTIVLADADLDMAIPKIVNAGFRKAGQVCTSVQRLLVDRRIVGEFSEKLVAGVKATKAGDPAHPDTIVGPMISLAHAERAEAWVAEALAGGAEILVGGKREGAVFEPTVLTGVDPSMKVVCEEIFAPVISLIPFDRADEAVEQANASPFGLAAGLFTSNIHSALRLSQRLRFGGVHINEASSARVDVMPFGGVKDSGFGREGPAYAIREMTEERLITVSY
ncbi:putative aldehyde dehydrogenase YfmT [Hartmannibacter diazotrophicus]|uniref:Putative aldehyde dehydrogenase YfmT n=1 Tax=Hartmannibacter diazotrophicus TaxID=1482074 RepID=A0A2C9D0H7_9HYPH|nr:aldehyde dehydrogenase family protein [Hartmannibacter diazotrophicus]SON53887.1 putative aldehyde dehydrogenase YfmT [Hartmannibacter diazotrophicus]